LIPFEELARANRPFEAALRRAFEDTLASGRYILGGQVEAFEAALADSLGMRHAIGVGSGFDAIALAFMAIGLREGEVVVPANTCMATILAVMRCGLTPVLSDPDPGTLQLDPADVVRRLTPRTVAILPVHLYGLVCDMKSIGAIASERGLRIVEDCAQAQGASFRGRPVGSFGDASAFSFYPTKNLGALGDGGAVATNDDATAASVRMLRNYGYRARGIAGAVGFNSRLDALQAAFLLAKLPHLEEICRRKNAIASTYDRGLSPAFRRPVAVPGANCARHLYPVLHPRRDEFREYLEARGIGTEIHYPVSASRQPLLSGSGGGRYPVAEAAADMIVSLPCSIGHTDDEIDAVVEAANRFAR
jgi:dTDP-4-amino-4,6-dideoxygalactose transaminase